MIGVNNIVRTSFRNRLMIFTKSPVENTDRQIIVHCTHRDT